MNAFTIYKMVAGQYILTQAGGQSKVALAPVEKLFKEFSENVEWRNMKKRDFDKILKNTNADAWKKSSEGIPGFVRCKENMNKLCDYGWLLKKLDREFKSKRDEKVESYLYWLSPEVRRSIEKKFFSPKDSSAIQEALSEADKKS